MAIYRVVNEAVSVPVRASLVTGQSASFEEAKDDSVLSLDKYGRPSITFAAVDRGGYIYTEQADEDTLENAGETGTYVGGASAVKRLARKGAVVEDDSLQENGSDEEEAEKEEAPVAQRRGSKNDAQK